MRECLLLALFMNTTCDSSSLLREGKTRQAEHNQIIKLVPFKGDTSYVVLFVACIGVSFCTVFAFYVSR